MNKERIALENILKEVKKVIPKRIDIENTTNVVLYNCLHIAQQALSTEVTEPSGIPSDKDLDFDSQYQKLFNAIADSGGTPLESEMQDIIRIVHRDFPISEPKMFSEEEVKELLYHGVIQGCDHWEENGCTQRFSAEYIVNKFLSISPKEGKETDKEKLIRLSNGQVSNFYERAMQRKLEPNQTEAEKEADLEQIIIDQINQSYNEHKGSNEAVQDAAYYIAKMIESKLSLARNQVIEELKEWVKFHNYGQERIIFVKDILEYLQTLKK